MKFWLFAAILVTGLAHAKVAPNFQGEILGGKKTSLKENLKPNRALLLSFWASWCAPCIEELRLVTDKLKADPSMPLDVLTVNVDSSETAADVKPAIKMHKFTFPVILDPKHEIFGKYHDAQTLPFSVLISPKGNIEATFNGYHEEMFAKVKAVLGNVGATKEENAKKKN